ncbi:hypothetical protein [Alkanindiges illinoisensis]|uniref:Uncharacterized protein n=1 Tax=Alkanindiges illinoisensis TaxID=197183 RepID=A0A4Y7XAH4_9GAMM|nr:hypothetical protein [Alkanindiges illinoisensis]TEU24979.1 hypothetical protein E2B99_10480 [Alkanindiges illinoisensis]
MTNHNPQTPDSQSLEQLQHTVDDDIRKMRDAQQFRTLEEKIQDLKDQGIDPAKTFDTRGDEDDD